MKRNKKRVLIALLAICALAAGGAAFTSQLGGQLDGTHSAVVGFGSESITGATADDVDYTTSSDGKDITSVDMYFPTTDNITSDAVKAGFETSGSPVYVTCNTAGTNTDPNPAHSSDNDVTCTFTGATGYTAAGEPVIDATQFDAAVS